jgi:nitrilase
MLEFTHQICFLCQFVASTRPSPHPHAGFEAAADAQIEAVIKNHALTAQDFVICASNPVDEICSEWMQKELGEQGYVKERGGWSAIIHPFCVFLGGPHTGKEEEIGRRRNRPGAIGCCKGLGRRGRALQET